MPREIHVCNRCARHFHLIIPEMDEFHKEAPGGICKLGQYLADTGYSDQKLCDTVESNLTPAYRLYENKFFSLIYSGSYHLDPKGNERMEFVLSSLGGCSWDEENDQPIYPNDATRIVFTQDGVEAYYLAKEIDLTAFVPTECEYCHNCIL
jgi:hypothetical protein